jgi:hypothetical protein
MSNKHGHEHILHYRWHKDEKTGEYIAQPSSIQVNVANNTNRHNQTQMVLILLTISRG